MLASRQTIDSAKRFCAGPPAAVVIVARRADRHVEQAARLVEAHRRPDVGVAGELPRAAVPGVVAELAALRDGVELPHQLSGARVERAHVAGRIVLVGEAIADAVADDDQVLVDDRRRRVGVVLLVDRPDQAFAQIDDAVVAESRDRRAGLRIELNQLVARVEEDAKAIAILPRDDAAMRRSPAVRRLAVFVRFRIVPPQLLAGRRIERRDLVVGLC